MTETFIGIDGCSGGWLCIRSHDQQLNAWISPTFEDVLAKADPDALIGIDIPIGLPATGGRECDRKARGLLGWPRRNSVFPAPIRPVIHHADFTEACSAHRSIDGGLT